MPNKDNGWPMFYDIVTASVRHKNNSLWLLHNRRSQFIFIILSLSRMYYSVYQLVILNSDFFLNSDWINIFVSVLRWVLVSWRGLPAVRRFSAVAVPNMETKTKPSARLCNTRDRDIPVHSSSASDHSNKQISWNDDCNIAVSLSL